jgi:hypothetical protein
MAHQLSGHLWNAVILVVSALVALAADRIAAPSRRASTPGALDVATIGDISSYVTRRRTDLDVPRFGRNVQADPFESGQIASEPTDVASLAGVPTVRSSAANGRRLTAILVADERRVAVVDDAAVGVGSVLKDGARVAAIQPDRVFVVEKNGRWRTLTLTDRGQ